MKRLFAIISIFLAFGCSRPAVKFAPEHQGIDQRAQRLYDEFIWLSMQKNITFKNQVTMGFKRIDRGNIIGMCTWGGYFREIDLDINYWNNTTNSGRLALVLHELGHCMCGRGHDYGEDLKYPETAMARMERALKWLAEGGPRPGYWDDGCPFSLMYPTIVDDDCIRTHYNEYVSELFDRCDPW